MKIFSTFALLAPLVTFASLVQASSPAPNIARYSARELVEELQTRMVLAKRIKYDHYDGPSRFGRRSTFYDDFPELTSRAVPAPPASGPSGQPSGPPGTASGSPGTASGPPGAASGSPGPPSGPPGPSSGAPGALDDPSNTDSTAGGDMGIGAGAGPGASPGSGPGSSGGAGAGVGAGGSAGGSTTGGSTGHDHASGGHGHGHGHGQGHGHGHGGHGSHKGIGSGILSKAQGAITFIGGAFKKVTLRL